MYCSIFLQEIMQGVHQIMAIKQQIWKHVTANIQLDTTKQN